MTVELIVFGFVLMGISAAFATVFLLSFYRGSFVKALIFKGCAGVCFVTLGAVNCFYLGAGEAGVIVFCGLCFGLLGDELIALCQLFLHHDKVAFVAGGLSFLVGHILYIVALFLLGGASWLALILSLVLISCIGGIYARRRSFLKGDMKYLLIGYLGIVILVTAVAISIFVKEPNLKTGLFAIGGAMFTVSDNILFAYKMGSRPRFLQNTILHIAYYLAQFAIAWSIAFFN